MLIIEGYSGKSLEVAKYVDALDNQYVLIITNDKSALNSITCTSHSRVYFTEQSNVEDIENLLKFNNMFNHVIFYQNVEKEDIDIYKELERKFDLEAILTVQSHDRENPREVTKYTV